LDDILYVFARSRAIDPALCYVMEYKVEVPSGTNCVHESQIDARQEQLSDHKKLYNRYSEHPTQQGVALRPCNARKRFCKCSNT
jgi:hypothetical protein